MTTPAIDELLRLALDKRGDLLDRLHGEQTDSYRLFHGISEGYSGLTVDRYGPQLIVQTFHQPIDETEQVLIQRQVCDTLNMELVCCYNDRSAANSRRTDQGVGAVEEGVCHELGVRYRTRGRHRGQDPLLFLDFRAARRRVRSISAHKTVLNLFAYSCGMGVCAALGGARETLNIDFARSALEVGLDNARLNGLDEQHIRFLQSDFFPAARQLGGLPVNFRRRPGMRPKHYPRLAAKQYDLVVLDPPGWAKSPFGTVDLIRDYASVFKPSLLATKPGGQMICTNNMAKVALDDWLDGLRRCAEKAGRPLRAIELITPEADFPSFDGAHPLKIALIDVD